MWHMELCRQLQPLRRNQHVAVGCCFEFIHAAMGCHGRLSWIAKHPGSTLRGPGHFLSNTLLAGIKLTFLSHGLEDTRSSQGTTNESLHRCPSPTFWTESYMECCRSKGNLRRRAPLPVWLFFTELARTLAHIEHPCAT